MEKSETPGERAVQVHLLLRSSQPFNSHPWYLYPLYICNLAITIPLKCQLVILFFISRDLSISAGGRRAKHKRRKKMKAERSNVIAADQSCSQSGLLSALILRTCNVCQQLYKCSGTRGRGLVFFGLAQPFKLWHGRSRREPRKQEGS